MSFARIPVDRIDAWQVARNAYRMLAAHARAAVSISILPSLLLLLASATGSWITRGDPFPKPSEMSEFVGRELLSIFVDDALHGTFTLLIFVSWSRYLLKRQDLTWFSFDPGVVKAGPAWLVASLGMTLIVIVVELTVILPLSAVLSLILEANDAQAEWIERVEYWFIYGGGTLAWFGSFFITAKLILRSSLTAVRLPRQSAVSDQVLGGWVRAATAFCFVTVPLVICDIAVRRFIEGYDLNGDWVGIITSGLSALLLGAIGAHFIEVATSRASGS